MNKVIIRVAKLKTIGNIAASGHHTFRETPTPNADGDRTAMNILGGAENTLDLVNAVRGRLPDKHRKDAVLCLEYLVSASPEHFGDDWRERQNHGESYFSDSLDWLKKKHGAENIVCSNVQLDERTPHMVVYVVPRLADGRLSAKEFTGGKAKLTKLQTDFAKDVGQRHELERGIEGSKARHTTVKEYYSRVNAAFQPLPEVKTAAPKNRPEPEKPGFLAGAAARDAYAADHAAWEQEQAQRKQHIAEVRALNSAAIETARRNEAQAVEAAALRNQVEQLKRANAHLNKVVAKLEPLAAVARLLTPDEVQAVHDRKQQQEAEKARLAELARQAAKIEAEAARRVDGIQKLLQLAGAEYAFGLLATEALREAGGNASGVDWKAVETCAVIEAMGRHGQSAENVTKALLTHSPLRADPATHVQLRNTINLNAPQLEAQYEQERNGPKRSYGTTLG